MNNQNLSPEDLDALDRLARKQSSAEEEAALLKRMDSDPEFLKQYKVSCFLHRIFQKPDGQVEPSQTKEETEGKKPTKNAALDLVNKFPRLVLL